MAGVSSDFDFRKPVTAEFSLLAIGRVGLTSPGLEYDPTSTSCAEQEEATTRFEELWLTLKL